MLAEDVSQGDGPVAAGQDGAVQCLLSVGGTVAGEVRDAGAAERADELVVLGPLAAEGRARVGRGEK